MQLIASMLCNKQARAGIKRKALRIAYPGCVALCGRKHLVCFARVIAPNAATSLKFGARIVPRYLGLAVLGLAGIGGGSYVHIQRSIGPDNEGMHGMIAAQRQFGDNRFPRI